MRAIVKMRKMITETDDLREMISNLESQYDKQIQVVFGALQQIIRDEPSSNKGIGLILPKNKED